MLDFKAYIVLPDYFGDISNTKIFLRKYLKEKCKSDTNWQLPFKYCFNLCLISKLCLKVCQVQTTIVKEISTNEWVEHAII